MHDSMGGFGPQSERMGLSAPARRRARQVLAAGLVLSGVVAAKFAAGWLHGAPLPTPEPAATSATPAGLSSQDSKLNDFVVAVVNDVDAMWARDFRRRDKPYTVAEPVLMGDDTARPCGPGVVFGEPECSGTHKVFIDLTFQRALEAKYGAASGAAQAYVIAHEMGHHVQRVLGLDKKVASLLANRPVATQSVQVELELQADCLAGVWSRTTKQRHLAEPTQLEAALRQASELGAERRIDGMNAKGSRSESFTYAIPRRRVSWFAKGYKTGKIEVCDTFAP